MFNGSWIVPRWAKGEFQEQAKNKGNPSKKDGHPPGTVGQMFRLVDHAGDEVATLHYFHCNGFLVTEPDPKSLKIAGKRYIFDPKAPDPTRTTDDLVRQRRIGCVLKWRCCRQGPADRLPLPHQS